ncbi:MAG: hypothetical protein Q7J25_05175 [Vicinamibacterales bacterium]|nr:hypothetical protein [Vicinamibacterales bacterium]
MADRVGVEARTALKFSRHLSKQVAGIGEGRCQYVLLGPAHRFHWRVHKAIVTPRALKRQPGAAHGAADSLRGFTNRHHHFVLPSAPSAAASPIPEVGLRVWPEGGS